MVQLCKDSIILGPGRGQEDGQGDLCKSQGSLWVQAWSPWRHQWWLLSLLSLPSPTLQVPGPRPQGRDASRQAESPLKLVGRTGDSTVTLCSLCCLWKGCSNPISSAFHGCQLFAGVGRPASEIRAIVWSLPPHVLIHPSCCPGPLCWLASPLPVASPPLSCPTFPSILGYSRPGLGCISQVPWEERRRGGGAGARDGAS